MGPDARIATLATRQRGLITRAQARGAGLSDAAIEHRIATGRLHAVHRGVFLVGHRAPAPLAAELAALLATGPDAVLSHATAAGLWSLSVPGDGSVHVTLPGSGGSRERRRRGVVLHAVGRLEPPDRARRRGLPVTSVPRTLLDLAGHLPERTLARVVEQAQVERLARPADLLALIERSRGRRGVARLRKIVDDVREPSLTRSEAEARLLDLMRAADLPLPRTNRRVRGMEVDCLWRENRLIVEVDGFRYHGTRAAFERDRRRDAVLAAAGYRVVRLTWRRITREPEAVVRELRALLGGRDPGSLPPGA
jgi:very-short-patch-repair endonuclease